MIDIKISILGSKRNLELKLLPGIYPGIGNGIVAIFGFYPKVMEDPWNIGKCPDENLVPVS
jgi:hypothetical protein